MDVGQKTFKMRVEWMDVRSLIVLKGRNFIVFGISRAEANVFISSSARCAALI